MRRELSVEKLSKTLANKKTKEERPIFAKFEFQDYGLRLAKDLSDNRRKSLYIKLAKEEKREFLEKARSFTVDYAKAKSRARLFMWALTQLKKRGRIDQDPEWIAKG